MLTVVGVALYGVYKLELLFSKADSQVSVTVEEGYFENNNSTFSQANGFNFAVGIFEYGEIVQDESYGKVYIRQFEMDRVTQRRISHIVKTRPCTAQDIPIGDESSDSSDGSFEDVPDELPETNDKR